MMLNGRRVVLEGLTVGRSVGLSLLPAVEMLERFPDVGTVAVVMF